jgi:tRNA(fMet)-specific endonuclease VapC
VGEASACTSVVVAAELWYGALKRQSARLTAQIELILSTLEIIPFDVPAERVYG